MRVEHGLTSRRGSRRVFLTIGNFDGVHRGHRALVDRVVAHARRQRGESVVLTFDPHPRCVLDPENCPASITTLDEKASLLSDAGVDRLIVLPFTRELSQWTPEHFCDRLLEHVALQRLIVGHDFALGRGRAGDVAFLNRYGARHGFEVATISALQRGGEAVSSTRIRVALREGRLSEANRLLGYAYLIDARVESGDRRGSRIGFPTANLSITAGKCLPSRGIYACWVQVGETWHEAATSIGYRPTFGGDHLTIEAYLLDFDGDLYGKRVRCVFEARLRDERMYPSAQALAVQIERDVERTRRELARRPHP